MFDIRDELEQVKAQLREILVAQRRRAMNEMHDANRKLSEIGWRPCDEHRYPVLSADEAAAQHEKRGTR